MALSGNRDNILGGLETLGRVTSDLWVSVGSFQGCMWQGCRGVATSELWEQGWILAEEISAGLKISRIRKCVRGGGERSFAQSVVGTNFPGDRRMKGGEGGNEMRKMVAIGASSIL